MTDQTPQVVVAGHICLDVIPELFGPAHFEPGKLVRIGPASVSTGGAVANTGLALHRLGVPVRLMGKVGDDAFGKSVLDVLRSHDARLADGMIVSKSESTSYSIVISPPGTDRSFLHCSGANDTFTSDDVRYELLDGAKIFHFGYPPLMKSLYSDGGGNLKRIFERVHAHGLATSLDLAQPDPNSEAGKVNWVELLAKVLPNVDVFLPSVDELLFMLDRSAKPGEFDGATVRKLGARLIEMGVTVAAIKLGDRGLYVRTSGDAKQIGTFCKRLGLDASAWANREVYAPCFKAKVVGTTGSGDCTIAGFLASLLRGESPLSAVTAATAVGACSVEAADATSGVPSWEKVQKRLKAQWPRLDGESKWGGGVSLRRDELGAFELVGGI